MNKIYLSVLLVAAGFSAVPASAQTASGQVAVTGFVAARCGTDEAGSATFSRSIDLGELTSTNGALSAAFTNSTESAPAKTTQFTIGCSGASSTITISATRLSNAATATGTLFSNDIDYTTEMKASLAAGGFATAAYTTAATLPAATNVIVSGSYAAVANNAQISIYGLVPENGISSFLVAGNYSSTITVTVAPTV